MQFFNDSSQTIPVVWYEVPEDRKGIEFNHVFSTRIYDREDEEQEDLGELFKPVKWRGCVEPCPCAGDGLTGTEDQWNNGVSIDDDLPDCYPRTNVPLSCAPLILLACGGIAYGDQRKRCHMDSTFDSYTPFGGVITVTNEPCVFVEDLLNGRGTSPCNTVAWTHYIEFAAGVVVLDGCTRTGSLNTQNYADGDEVRVPTGGVARYVVVWVTLCDTDSGIVKRAYLMRHQA